MAEAGRPETLLAEVRLALGRRVRELREGLQLPQSELGKLVGMAESSIGTIERGDRGCNPTLRNLLLLVQALQVQTIDDLLKPLSSDEYSRVVWHADAPERESRLGQE